MICMHYVLTKFVVCLCKTFLLGILNFAKMVSIRKISQASLDSYTREQMRHQIDSQGQATGEDDTNIYVRNAFVCVCIWYR
jgi:hypothetical protein